MVDVNLRDDFNWYGSKICFDLIYPLTPFEVVEVSGIGVVIPGIIANTIQNKVL